LETTNQEAEVSKTCCLGLAQLLLKCNEELLNKYYVRLLKTFAKVMEKEAEASEEYHKSLAVRNFYGKF
jgi:hypothetical protein